MKFKVKLQPKKPPSKPLRRFKKPASEYSEVMAYKVKDLAAQGLNKNAIIAALGISGPCFRKWLKEIPEFRKAFKKGCRNKKRPTVPQFFEYVYDRLPQELKELWDQLSAWEKEDNAVRKIELLLKDKSEQVLQHLYLHALASFNFNPNRACKALNISLNKVKEWSIVDPNFASLITNIQEIKENFLEGALLNLVAEGDSNAIVFCARTQLKHRGYNEKVQIDHTHSGNINHTHTIGEKELARLPLAQRQAMLTAIDTLDSESIVEAPAPARLIKAVKVETETNHAG